MAFGNARLREELLCLVVLSCPVLSCPDRNEREQLLAFPGDRQQRLQHYTLSDSDLAVIGERDLLPCHLFRFVS